MKKSIQILFLTFITWSASYAQCDIEHLTTMFASNIAPLHLGQSFTAECDGVLESFRIHASEAGTLESNTFHIYEGNTISGAPIYSQTFSDFVIENVDDPMIFDVTGNVPLSADSQYTFYLVTNINIFAAEENPYPGGSIWVNATNAPELDISFGVTIADGSLGTSDIAIQNAKVYPNPTSDYIQISNATQFENYTIYNTLGKIVSNGNMNVNERIDVRSYSNGLYFLKFDNGSTFRFIKN